jgi:hypothetical protein
MRTLHHVNSIPSE